jgi:hypothetical protein
MNCWIWDGAINQGGYGYFWGKEKNKQVRAHRFFYEKFIGPIPAGMQVNHHCDNPSCVNPEHLFVGTQSDNIQDAWDKKRMVNNLIFRQGERHPSAKLSQHDVDIIRARSILGEKYQAMAIEYDMSYRGIQSIVRTENWRGTDI